VKPKSRTSIRFANFRVLLNKSLALLWSQVLASRFKSSMLLASGAGRVRSQLRAIDQFLCLALLSPVNASRFNFLGARKVAS